MISHVFLLSLVVGAAAGPIYCSDIDRMTPWNNWAGRPATSQASLGTVVIPAGVSVVLSSDPEFDLGVLEVTGTLAVNYTSSSSVKISAHRIIVQANGRVVFGSAECPLLGSLEVELTGAAEPGNDGGDGLGTKVIGVQAQGQLDIHGSLTSPSVGDASGRTWWRLASNAAKGATSVTLDAAAHGLVAGDTIVIASTDYEFDSGSDYNGANPCHAVRTLTGVAGAVVSFAGGLACPHYGGRYTPAGAPSAHSISMGAEVGLLNRNIKIYGDDQNATDGWGGHLMCMPGGEMRVRSAELHKMGQLNELGRYPIHYHIADAQNFSYVVQNSIHDTYQRAVTCHGARHLLVSDNVGYNVAGHMYFIEDGDEYANTFQRNLGIRATVSTTLLSDTEPSIFWITNPGNHFYENAAVDAKFGFWYAMPDTPTGFAKGEAIFGRFQTAGDFEDNVAHSCNAGLFIDRGQQNDAGAVDVLTEYRPRNYDASLKFLADKNIIQGQPIDFLKGKTDNFRTQFGQADPAVIKRFTAFKNSAFGMWGRGDHIWSIGARLADNSIGSSWPTRAHLFQDGVVIGDSDNVGDVTRDVNRWYPNEGARTRPAKYWISKTLIGYQQYDAGCGDIVLNTKFYDFQDEVITDNSPPNAVFGTPFSRTRTAAAISAQTGPNVLALCNRFYLGPNAMTRVDNPVYTYKYGVQVNGTGANTRILFPLLENTGDDAVLGITTVDHDGSITGVCGQQIIGAAAHLLIHSGCTLDSAANSYACPNNGHAVRHFNFGERYPQALIPGILPGILEDNTLNIYRLDTSARAKSSNRPEVDKQYDLAQQPYADIYKRFNQNLRVNQEYMMVLGQDGSAAQSLAQFDFSVTEFLVGEWVKVAFPYPANTGFVVTRNGAACTEVANKAAMTSPFHYTFDQSAGLLWLYVGILNEADYQYVTLYDSMHGRTSSVSYSVTANCSTCTHYVDPNTISGPAPSGPTADLCEAGGSWTKGSYSYGADPSHHVVYSDSWENGWIWTPSEYPWCAPSADGAGGSSSSIKCDFNPLCNQTEANINCGTNKNSNYWYLNRASSLTLWNVYTHLQVKAKVGPGFGPARLRMAFGDASGDSVQLNWFGAEVTNPEHNFQGSLNEDYATWTIPVSAMGVDAAHPDIQVIYAVSYDFGRPTEVFFDDIRFGNFAPTGPTAVSGYPTAPVPPTRSGPGLVALPVGVPSTSTSTTSSVSTSANGGSTTTGDSSVSGSAQLAASLFAAASVALLALL